MLVRDRNNAGAPMAASARPAPRVPGPPALADQARVKAPCMLLACGEWLAMRRPGHIGGPWPWSADGVGCRHGVMLVIAEILTRTRG